jgi:hypothetical protein
MVTLDQLKQTRHGVCLRYAGEDKTARCRFIRATLDAASLIEKRFQHAARETASFHVISGSTVTPAMKITRLEFEHLSMREILDAVERHLTDGVPLDRVFA